MAKYYGTNVNAEGVVVARSSESHVVRGMWLNGWYAVIRQTVTTEVVHYEGLSKTDAESLCTSSESSVLGGTTRTHLGGATLTRSNTAGSAWMHCDDCWGTRVSSSMRRMGLSRMYEVDVTTETITVSSTGGTLTLT